MPVKQVLQKILFKRRKVIISFPKSGRSWYRVLLDELGVEVKFDHLGSDLALAEPWQKAGYIRPIGMRQAALLTRDPRDAVVSAFYHLRDRVKSPYDGTMSDFIRDPRFGIEKAARFNLLCAEQVKARRGLVISYEETHENPIETLDRTARFFGCSPSRERLADVAERNVFSRMRERELSGELGRHGAALGATTPGDERSLKLRKGRVGGYVDDLSDDDAEFCHSVLQRLAYAERMSGHLGR